MNRTRKRSFGTAALATGLGIALAIAVWKAAEEIAFRVVLSGITPMDPEYGAYLEAPAGRHRA